MKNPHEIPPGQEIARRENFLVSKGMKRSDARDLMPNGKDRKHMAELLKARLRESPKRS
jgi:hypothetical protein